MDDDQDRRDGQAGPAGDDFATPPLYPPVPTQADIDAYQGSRALRSPPRSDVNLDVPYLHQLWDTPEDFNGHWACGPTSAAMVLAFYELLPPRPLELEAPFAHVSDYGWYVARPFTLGGKAFDAVAETRTGRAAGLYGAVIDRIGSGWGAHWRSPQNRGIRPLMDAFLPGVGNGVRFVGEPKRSGTPFLERDAAERALTAGLDGGHPAIVSGRFTFRGETYDHLIVVRGYVRDAASGELRWIVNDPYGFETTGAGFDGGNVVYDFDEIKPKWMCVFDGPHRPRAAAAPERDQVPVRLFDPVSNRPIGEGTLIAGTDKVYVRRLDPESNR